MDNRLLRFLLFSFLLAQDSPRCHFVSQIEWINAMTDTLDGLPPNDVGNQEIGASLVQVQFP